MIALYQSGIPVSWQQMIFDETEHEKGERNKIVNSLINNDIEYNKVILHLTPEHWPAKIKQYKKEGVEIIGYTVWETDKLDERWVDWINMVDKVVVPCNWNKEVFKNCGVFKPIEVVPHIYHPRDKINATITGINNDDFVFYTIGQWSNRKGIDDVVRAYLNAFTAKNKVCLVIKTFRSNHSEEEKQLIRNYINNIAKDHSCPAKIILLLDEYSDDQITALHNIGHCYVSLTKAEGWGLGAFDAAGIGNPVIITGYGGQLDFVQRYLVNYELVSVEGMSWIPWYNNSQRWAQPDIEHATSKLQAVYENKGEVKGFAWMDKTYIEKNFNSKIVVDKLIKFLE